MQYIIFIILICFFIFLLSVYAFCNDDFVLFKKHVTTERVFNIAFLLGLFGLLASRFVYVLFHFAPGFLNPLVFFLFPYFPGLSLMGGVIGAVIYFTISAYVQKLPYGHLLDFFSLSFLFTLPLGFILYLLVMQKQTSIAYTIPFLILLVLPFLFKTILKKNLLKDGSTGIVILFFVSLISFVASFLEKRERLFWSLTGEDIVIIIFCFVLVVIFVQQEKIMLKATSLFKKGNT